MSSPRATKPRQATRAQRLRSSLLSSFSRSIDPPPPHPPYCSLHSALHLRRLRARTPFTRLRARTPSTRSHHCRRAALSTSVAALLGLSTDVCRHRGTALLRGEQVPARALASVKERLPLVRSASCRFRRLRGEQHKSLSVISGDELFSAVIQLPLRRLTKAAFCITA